MNTVLAPAPAPRRSLIDDLLDEQSAMPAVETFARWHGENHSAKGRYAALLPTHKPRPGQQYAFEVDLDGCTGCKACVVACHSLNGLTDRESWRSTGQLVSTDWRNPLRQTVTTACHHCVEPACASGCPTLAYEKDADTGIVRHLDDQCIGCSYCTMTCPYEVPQFEKSRGIVRKCDMCRQRLDTGEAPACVQACPNGAIRIVLVETESLRRDAVGASLLPTAPLSSLTIPSTRFVSAKPLPSSMVPDRSAGGPQPAHLPLAIMLLLTQCGVGSLAASWLAGDQVLAVCGAILAMAGGLAAALHLGRPWQAWRAWIGWRRSWLSREIILFGLHGPLALIYALGQHRVVGALTVATGVAGVFASGVLYHVTRREWWRGGRSVGRFLLTAALAGSAAAFLRGLAPGWVLALCGAIKCGAELHWLQVENPDLADEAHDPSRSREWMVARGVRLLDEHYGILNRSRFLCALLGGILLPLACQGLPAALTAVSLCAAAEIVERLLFFRAAVPAPMPGWNPANDP